MELGELTVPTKGMPTLSTKGLALQHEEVVPLEPLVAPGYTQISTRGFVRDLQVIKAQGEGLAWVIGTTKVMEPQQGVRGVRET
jgi:hypothetical protein